jgi:hypothetical protein
MTRRDWSNVSRIPKVNSDSAARAIPTVISDTAARTRYRDQALNWIAIGVLLGAWQLEAQLDREQESQQEPRLALGKPAYTRDSLQLWNAEPRARSWIRRVKTSPHGKRSY